MAISIKLAATKTISYRFVMNIAIDIRCLMEREPTGVGEYTLNLLRAIFAADKDNQYLLFYNSAEDVSDVLPAFNEPNVRLCGFSYPNKWLNFSLKFFKRPRLDLLIQKKFGTKPDIFFFPNISFLQTQCPYIITCHDLSYALFPEFLSPKKRLWHSIINPRKLFANAKGMIAVSENTKADLMNHYQISPDKIEMIYSGIPAMPLVDNNALIETKATFKLPEKFVLAVGTVEPRKNVDTLISAFNAFAANHSEYSLVMTGKPCGLRRPARSATPLSGVAGGLKATEKVLFTGFTSSSEKAALYRLATIFAYPSHYEGFGFPPLEAMSQGCPVISANNSSLGEVCGDAAILINAHDANALAQALEQMADPSVREHYKAKGFAQIRKFSWQTAATATIDLFKKII